MAAIDTYLEDIKNKTYGEDVRDAIHDGILQCYQDSTANAQIERIIAKGQETYNSIPEKYSTLTDEVDVVSTLVITVESGKFYSDHKSKETSANYIRSVTPIPLPLFRRISLPTGYKMYAYYFDKNMTYLGSSASNATTIVYPVTTPAAAVNTVYANMEILKNDSVGQDISAYVSEVNSGLTIVPRIATDKTLSVSDAPADGKSTGDRIAAVESSLSDMNETVDTAVLKTVRYGNRYNPENNVPGVITANSVGETATLSADSTMCSQLIPIDYTKKYTIKGIRAWEAVDKNKKVVASRTLVTVTNTALIDVTAKPNAKFIYVSTYYANVSGARFEEGTSLGATYTPYMEYFDGYKTDGQLDKVPFELGWKGVEGEHDAENQKQEIKLLKSYFESMASVKTNPNGDSVNVQLENNSAKKLILHLHKRANNEDFDSPYTDVFLPNATDDFSDVRIKDNNGNLLPYSIVYSGNVDIIADYNLPKNPTGRIYKNSQGEWITYHRSLGIAKSTDNGKTWTHITSTQNNTQTVMYVSAEDALFFAKNGEMWRVEYPYSGTPVKVLTITGTTPYFLSQNMEQTDSGALFVCAYQTENKVQIFKSTDDGVNWAQVYLTEGANSPQHIHHIHVDRSTTPNTIYCGCDGTGQYIGTVLKSTDEGATWTNLRSLHPNMPQATDFGVIFSNASFRLLGGETPSKGGYSIIRTDNDSSFMGVLGIGSAFQFVLPVASGLVGGIIAARQFRNVGIVYCNDSGRTWKTIYNIPHLPGNGENDGYRYMSDMGDQIVAGGQDHETQGVKCPPLRIYSGQNCHYAEIIVDIPDWVSRITVEDGYMCGIRENVFNDYESVLPKIIDFKFNEPGNLIKEYVSGRYYYGSFLHANGGKHLGNIYPYITKAEDSVSLKIPPVFKAFTVEGISFSGNGMTINFWANLGKSSTLVLLENGTNEPRMVIIGNALYVNGVNVSGLINSPGLDLAIYMITITIDFNNNVLTIYSNGIKLDTVTGHTNVASFINGIKEVSTIDCLRSNAIDNVMIQHFTIYGDIASESEVSKMYLNGLT